MSRDIDSRSCSLQTHCIASTSTFLFFQVWTSHLFIALPIPLLSFCCVGWQPTGCPNSITPCERKQLELQVSNPQPIKKASPASASRDIDSRSCPLHREHKHVPLFSSMDISFFHCAFNSIGCQPTGCPNSITSITPCKRKQLELKVSNLQPIKKASPASVSREIDS